MKYKSFIMPCSYHMRYQHFPLFTHGIVRVQSKCPASKQAGSYVVGVSTASSSAMGSMYARVHYTPVWIVYALHAHGHHYILLLL